MDAVAATFLLAAAPVMGPYVNLVKVGVVVGLLAAWAAGVQWVDRDTDVVKTKREEWNLIVISGGVVATFVLLFVPYWRGGLFFVGLVFWLLLAGGSMYAYVMHRNGRVVPAARILTIDHIRRLAGGERGKKKAGKSKTLRVQITDHAGQFVEMPDDLEELNAFELAQDFLYNLLWRRAADAEILASKEKYRLVYRVDGVATESPDGIPPEGGEKLFRYLKKLAGLNVEEIRRPQTGRIKVAMLSQETEPGHTEVQTSGTTAGERMRLRIASGPTLLRLHELGLDQQRLNSLKQILAKGSGVFVISAPPQNGLTTTQYAVLRGHDAYMNNIHTVERRPFTELDNITQQQFQGGNTDVNYSRTLQTILRREPDIVLVGECEDRETAIVATRAAVEGRKIYMGIHAKDTFDALNKYLTLLGDNRAAAKALLGVMNQRLIRILCTECREAFEPDPATLKKLNLPADKIQQFYRPPTEVKRDKRGREVPCGNCQGSGYVGRTAIFELLVVDPAIAQLVAEGTPIDRIRAQCRKNKMYYLQETGLLKVIDGTTSMNEILRCLKTNEK
jgi:type II secretory ATPase GspE/PulE/Tfp pilus assembly ATPase PilB-like protein